MTTKTLKERVLAGERVFGAMILEFFVPALPQLVKAAGAEFLFLDMEHTGISFETLKGLIAGCRGIGLPPIVRVPATQYDYISRVLDIGAHGVMVPIVETREQAEFIVSCTRYPPEGRRGAAFGVAHDDYLPGSPVDKIAAAHRRNLVITQIETPKGVENSAAIAAVPNVDVLWVGHFDLTNFMGIPGQFEHPDYLAALAKVVGAARKNGKGTGFMCADERWGKEYLERGFSMMAFGMDSQVYQKALAQGIATLKQK
jgi:2-dehydro-3-deoxyglucarate aldolase/4-hydroxy-2-oxoheptanedioate aldolase